MRWERDLPNGKNEAAYLNLNVDQLGPSGDNLSIFGEID
jgi:hypothetical protein